MKTTTTCLRVSKSSLARAVPWARLGIVLSWLALAAGLLAAVPQVHLDIDGNNFATENGLVVGGTIYISLNAPLSSDLVVNLAISGTAINGVDYEELPVEVLIENGSYNVELYLFANNDGIAEGPETVRITILPSPAYTIGGSGYGDLTIVDDDVNVSVTASGPAYWESGSAAGQFALPPPPSKFTFSLPNALPYDVTVYYQVSGAASPGSDYVALPGSVLIPHGQASVAVNLQINQDSVSEPNEPVIVTLLPDPSYSINGAAGQAQILIKDDDASLVSVAPLQSATETGTPGKFTILRAGYIDSSITVSFSLGGTATHGTDYPIIPLQVSMASGVSSVDVTYSPANDGVPEGRETVVLTLLAGANYTIGTPNNTFTYIADAQLPVVTSMSVADSLAIESTAHPAVIEIHLNGPSSTYFSVSVASLAGWLCTACIEVEDVNTYPHWPSGAYSAGLVNFVPGQTVGQLVITPVNDGVPESPELLFMWVLADAAYAGSVPEPGVSVLFVDTPPATPSVTAAVADHRVTLSWPWSGGVEYYHIKRSSSPAGPFVEIGQTSGSGTFPAGPRSYQDTTVANGQTYYYVVCGTWVGGATPNSAVVTATLPDFESRLDFATGSGPIQTAAADLDGDGKPDVAVANTFDSTVSVFRNTSSGGLNQNSLTLAITLIAGVYPNPYSAFMLVAADVDGDGKVDLITANHQANTVSVLRNTSTGVGNFSFAAKIDYTVGNTPVGLAVRDVDGDGKPEIVTANWVGNSASVLRNLSSAGSISFATHVDFTAGSQPHSVALGDLDGDGKPEMVIGNNGSHTVSVFRNQAVAGGISASSFAAPVSLSAGGDTVAIGDWDGDGKADLVTGSWPENNISLVRNTSTVGTLAFASAVEIGTGAFTHTVALGDLNGDGKIDLAAVTEMNSSLLVYYNQSTPGSITTSSISSPRVLGTGFNAVGVSLTDLDGDSRRDVLFANTYDNFISVYRNLLP